jgi:FKBP-type peptidyl-prolyl cis-trans isomerase 2
MKVENGKKIKVHYTAMYENGEVFDSSRDNNPLEFTVGSGQLISGFENGVVEMSVGETKTINISPENGYGERREDLFSEVNTDQLPQGVQVGNILEAMTPEGPVAVVVKEINGDKSIIDANHPLAGKNLVFEVEVLEVV